MHRLAVSVLASILAAARLSAAADSDFTPITVRAGDTLWSISQKYLKDPKRWNEILKCNKLPTQDPTVALPGMELKVPTGLLKTEYQAATLEQVVRSVLSRKKESAAWDPAKQGKLLYDGDGLRTLAKSWARVKFFGDPPPVLSIDPDSMAILKSPKQSDHDIMLNKGAVHTEQARVWTPSAKVVPTQEGTKYTARVLDDLSTRVQVYRGAAKVSDAKGAKSVEVKAGFFSEIPLDRVPSLPMKIPNIESAMKAELAEIPTGRMETLVNVRRAPAPGGDAAALAASIKEISVGVPVAAYTVQVGNDPKFSRILYESQFDAYESIDLKKANLPDGRYWVRVAIVDLLGEKGRFTDAKPYVVGGRQEATLGFKGAFEVTRPEAAEVKVGRGVYRVMGRADPDLQVLMNGERVAKDEGGTFSIDVQLQKGENVLKFQASDLRGNDKTIIRRIVYNP
ncbi:MAG: LysM peptidoglycan-binding domain-containing protein [Elusimicrobiota bacterium]